MERVFIDTNMYLRFFDNSKPEFKKLLDALTEIKDQIFVTRQVVFEVERNKLIIFKNSFTNYSGKKELTDIYLPEHLDSPIDKDFKKWNDKRKQLVKECEEQRNKLQALFIKKLGKISKSEDPVSISLEKIFSKAIDEKKSELYLAKKRKERGNPPGKQKDTLGDQISWEQLLNDCGNVQQLWIISNDSDFIVEMSEECFLNPFLLRELKQRNSSITVNIFNSLAKGIEDYSNKASKRIERMPTGEELGKISDEERSPEYFLLTNTAQMAGVSSVVASAVSPLLTISSVMNPLGTITYTYPYGGTVFNPGSDSLVLSVCTQCGNSVQRGTYCSMCGMLN